MKSKIQEALEIANSIDQALDGIAIKGVDNYVIPATFFSTAIEHQRSVVVLVENKLYGSAASLLRSIFESYVKGLWFQIYAKEEDYKRLKHDKFKKTFGGMVSDLDKTEEKGLSKAKKELWTHLNSLTHTGWNQLGRRMSDTEIRANYDVGFIKDMLRISSNYGFLSCIGVAKMSDNPEVIKQVTNISNVYGFPRR